MSTKHGLTAVALAALVLSTATGPARACGEEMYRTGGALRYHAFITRHPADILVYAGAAPSAHGDELHRSLERAGHKVTVIVGAEALSHALTVHHYDVIIASAGDLPEIDARFAHMAADPSLIPVFPGTIDDASRKRYPLAMNEDANLNQFLRAIEQTMKARGT